jgi:hypothetical protein
MYDSVMANRAAAAQRNQIAQTMMNIARPPPQVAMGGMPMGGMPMGGMRGMLPPQAAPAATPPVAPPVAPAPAAAPADPASLFAKPPAVPGQAPPMFAKPPTF